MTYFFFGTLMDSEVLATVLDRPVAAEELSRAWLRGYQRVRAAHASYPLLVPAPGVVVGGVVFQPRDERDDVRIRHFEDGEYAERWLIVQLTGGGNLAARVFIALEVVQATDEDGIRRFGARCTRRLSWSNAGSGCAIVRRAIVRRPRSAAAGADGVIPQKPPALRPLRCCSRSRSWSDRRRQGCRPAAVDGGAIWP